MPVEMEWENVDEILKKELEELEKLEKEEKKKKEKLEKAKKKGIVEAKLTALEFGKFGDFMRPETLERLNRNPEDEAVRIVVENTELDIRVVRVYKRSLNENANWRKFLKRYGGKKTITLKYDPDKDRWDILL